MDAEFAGPIALVLLAFICILASPILGNAGAIIIAILGS
jgi:hypothetical protein